MEFFELVSDLNKCQKENGFSIEVSMSNVLVL